MKVVFSLLLLLSVALFSCLKDDVPFPEDVPTRVDTLRGDWVPMPVVLRLSNGMGTPVTVNTTDTCHFYADLTGRMGLSPVIAPYNFTWELLADDSTLIMNTNPAGMPSYDTSIITRLSMDTLGMTTRRKYVAYPGTPGYYDITWKMHR